MIHLRVSWARLSSMVGLDVLFLLVFGFIQAGIMAKVAQYLFMMQVTPEDITQPVAMVLVLLLLYYIFVFIAYTFLEGTAWWLSRKGGLQKYIKWFFWHNKWLFVIFIVFSVVNYIINYKTGSSVLVYLFLIVFYFYFVSYKKQGIKYGIRKVYLLVILLAMNFLSMIFPILVWPGGVIVLLGLSWFRAS